MSRYISESLRQEVGKRAGFRCEYCRISEANAFYSFQVDHIISLKHGGKTEQENLALACSICNRNKGTDLGTIIEGNDSLIPFFNPRKEIWDHHFEVEKSGEILPLTSIGKATIQILGFNHPDSVLERKLLIITGEFP